MTSWLPLTTNVGCWMFIGTRSALPDVCLTAHALQCAPARPYRCSEHADLPQLDTVIITGMVTSECVRATVDDAFAHDDRVMIPAEGVAERAEVPRRVNLFDMEMISADVLSLEEILPSARGRVDKPWRLWNGRASRWPARERR